MKKIILVLILVVFLIISLVGCSVNESEAPHTNNIETDDIETENTIHSGEIYTISIRDRGFSPAEIEIKVNDMIEWLNQDEKEHTITFNKIFDKTIIDEKIPSEGTFTHIFTETGRFRYHSKESIEGVIVVS